MAKQAPKIWYGLHFYPGVAEYRNNGEAPMRVYLNENTIRSMDASFAGRPVYVRHVEEVHLRTLQQDADGYVVKSFYNEADGKHWVQFIAVSDKAHEAIQSGARLSNAYILKSEGSAGTWNGVDYTREVLAGEYEHLALVNDPRYNESIILSPEDFKLYNINKLFELKKIANSSTSERKSMLSFFKKTKVENETKIEELTVTLPKTGKEITIAELIASADVVKNAEEKEEKKEAKEEPKEAPAKEDKSEEKSEEKSEAPEEKSEEKSDKGEEKSEEKKVEAPQMADLDHHVMVGNSSMPVRDLMAKHAKMEDCMNSLAAHHADLMKQGDAVGMKPEAAVIQKNSQTEDKVDHFSKVSNARDEAADFQSGIVSSIHLDGLAKGKARYGSKK